MRVEPLNFDLINNRREKNGFHKSWTTRHERRNGISGEKKQ